MIDIIKSRFVKLAPKLIGLGLNTLSLPAPKLAASKALDIFCTPRNGKIKPFQKKFLRKFEQKKINYDGVEVMTYHRIGNGARVLLCHGWESNSFRWRKFYRHIEDTNLDIVMMDAPAHGQTGSEKFNALLYAEMMNTVIQEFKPSVVIGHSVGAMSTVMAVHLFDPASIEKVVLLAPPDRLSDITDNYFKIISGNKRLRYAYDGLFVEKFGNPIKHFGAAIFASKLTMPCLVIHDEGDKINLYEEGVRVHESWSGSQLVTTQNFGHSLQSTEVFEKMFSFIEE